MKSFRQARRHSGERPPVWRFWRPRDWHLENIFSGWMHRYPLVFACGFAVSGVIIDHALYRDFLSCQVRWSTVAGLALLIALIIDVIPIVGSLLGIRAISTVALASGLTPGLARLTAIGLLVMSVFGLWHGFSENRFRSAGVHRLVQQGEQPMVLRGRVHRTVSLRPHPIQPGDELQSPTSWLSQIELRLSGFRSGDGFAETQGRILVDVDADLSRLRPGDLLEVHGWLKPFVGPTNPGEPDLRPNYRRRRLHGRLQTESASAVRVISRSSRTLDSVIATMATRGRESLLRHTGRQTGPLAIALVIGQREFVDRSTRDALLATGTAHLLSVSGMHLAILVVVANWIVSAIGLRTFSRLLVIVTVSLIYVAVTGGRPPVVRAAILIAMLLLAACFRRSSQPLNTLALAALLLIALNPMNVFAIGVHLSFLAVVTLVMTGRPVSTGWMIAGTDPGRQKSFDRLLESSRPVAFRIGAKCLALIGSMAWVSASIAAVSLPLVWHQFHLISFVSVLSNVLVWAGLMVALPCGVLTVMLDPIHPLLGTLPGCLCDLSLRYMWMVIDWTARWRTGHVWLPSPPTAAVALFYLCLPISLLWKGRRVRIGRYIAIVTWMLGAVFLATRPASLPEQTIEATFIDVGHGTSVVLRTRPGQIWLYDCGRMGNRTGSSRDIDTALWALGATEIDVVFLSHADADHYNALPSLLERFRINKVVIPLGMLDRDETAIRALREAITRRFVPIYEVHAGNEPEWLTRAGATVLHPPRKGVAGSDNANSLVLSLAWGNDCLLLPGDLEPPGTDVLTSMPRPSGQGMLMAPHHGSLSMDAETVLAWAHPSVVVVSGGRRALQPRVREMLSFAGSEVHITARAGAVRVRMDLRGDVEVRHWSTHPW